MNSASPSVSPGRQDSYLTRKPSRRMSLKRINLTFFAGFLFLTASQMTVRGQSSPTPTPESEQVIRLREQKTRAELERDIAVAEKAKLDASFPKPTTSPLTGETKINDGAVIESEMVTYLSMAYAANRIVEQLKDAKNADGSCLAITNLAIYNKADIDLLLNYKATTAQLKILRQELCKLVPEARQCGGARIAARSTAPLGIIGSFLGAFVDLTALLRTNVTVQGHTFDISEAALVSEVFRAARAPEGLSGHPNLYYPATFSPTDPGLQTSELLLILEDLHDLKARVLVAVHDLEERQKGIAKVKAEIDKLKALIEGAPDQIKAAQSELDRLLSLQKELEQKHQKVPFDKLERIAQLQESIPKMQQELADAPGKKAKAEAKLQQLLQGQTEDEIQDLISRMKLVNDRFDQLVATLIKVDSATGINSLTAYIRAENLTAVMKDQHSCWLQLAVVRAGGNNRIKTNLVVDIFTGGSRLSHSGGVVVQYNLYDLTGKSIASDTFTEYTGYIKAGKIKRLPNPVTVLDVPKRTPTQP
jgi:hypothetical protein